MQTCGSIEANGIPLTGTPAVLATIAVVAWIVFQSIAMLRLATRAGYTGALSLIMLVPGVNSVLVLLFAFIEWPIERKVEMYERAAPLPTAPPS